MPKLKLRIAKLEDVEEAVRPLYVKQDDGSFALDAEAPGEDPKLAEFRENNRKMKAELDAWQALGLTSEQAKARLAEQQKKAEDAENEKLSAKQLQEKFQKQLDEAVTKAAAECDRKATPSEKRKAHGGGRPQLELSKLPRVVVEVPDPDLEATAQRIGFEDSYQYLRQRGGWSRLPAP